MIIDYTSLETSFKILLMDSDGATDGLMHCQVPEVVFRLNKIFIALPS